VTEPQHILLDGQDLKWRLVRSPAAKKMRIKVGLDGVQVVVPEGRDSREAATFLAENGDWVIEQLARIQQIRALRRPATRNGGHVFFRGESLPVHVLCSPNWHASNKVALEDGAIAITCKPNSKTPPTRSLENWFRKQARERITSYVSDIEKRVNRKPNRIYVMGQRTKWGNCSALSNLSFNWRLVMAPDFVLRYIVTHEMVHLVVPDHSRKFWLTVQSLCPDAERARQWLVANGARLQSAKPEDLYTAAKYAVSDRHARGKHFDPMEQ